MRANKRLGQHFLGDRRAVHRIVDALDPQPGRPLVEIGPGRGALTGELIARGGRIAAIEVDPELIRHLREQFTLDELLLMERDVLRLPFSDVLVALGRRLDERIRVVGNLPYNISKPVAMKLVDERERIERAVLMFQREVGERLTAAVASRSYGPMTVLCGSAFRIRCLFHLRPGSFRPRPKVDSTVTLWEPIRNQGIEEHDLAALKLSLRASFASRRQTLRNNLRAALRSPSCADELLRQSGLDGRLRPEAIAPSDYLRLARAWPSL